MVRVALCALGILSAPHPARADTNLIQNGDFSQGLQFFTTTVVSPGGFSGYPKFEIFSSPPCLPSQAGNPYLAIDVPGGADGYVEQQVALPAAPTSLSFRTWGALDPVTVTISVITVADATEHALDTFTPPSIQNSETTCSGATDISKSYDLSAFAGQTISVRLRATAGGADGTIAGFDDLVIPAPTPLSAKITAKPTQVGVDDHFTVTMTATNSGSTPLTDVMPTGPLTASGDGKAMLLTGPTPASLATLAAGSSQDFVYTYQATVAGALTLQGELQATQADGSMTTATAQCSLGSAITRALPRADTCPVGGGVTVAISDCKLVDISAPLELDRLTGDGTPHADGHHGARYT